MSQNKTKSKNKLVSSSQQLLPSSKSLTSQDFYLPNEKYWPTFLRDMLKNTSFDDQLSRKQQQSQSRKEVNKK